MNTIRNILYILALLFLFSSGYYIGRNSGLVTTVETVRIDTVYYEKPKPFSSSTKTVAVNIPRILFLPSDTIKETVRVHVNPDSTHLRVDIEKREYKDSTYYAVVSGPAIGGYRPQLDWIETYNITRTRTQNVSKNKRWGLGVTAGYGCFAVDGTIKTGPTLSVGVSYHIFSW